MLRLRQKVSLFLFKNSVTTKLEWYAVCFKFLKGICQISHFFGL